MLEKNTNIIKELGLDELPENAQAEILTKMGEVVLKEISVKVLSRLSDSDLEEFEKVREEGSPEEVEKFLRAKVDDFDKLVENTVDEFKEEFKANVKKLKEQLL